MKNTASASARLEEEKIMITAFVIMCGVALIELFIIVMLYVAVAMLRKELKEQHTVIEPVSTVTDSWREVEA